MPTPERMLHLICADLDRTLLPNGSEPESPEARPRFRRLASRPDVRVAYVSGRNRDQIASALGEYELPEPDFAIADVGATIYSVRDDGWHEWTSWNNRLATDWPPGTRERLRGSLRDLEDLIEQEDSRQGPFKLSYFVATGADPVTALARVRAAIVRSGAPAASVWSTDAVLEVGLLDVLPPSATKLHAIEHLMEGERIDHAHTVFAGDSGNDLSVLVSGVPSVLVANATGDVRAEAVRRSERAGTAWALYLPRGGLFGMNGNYAGGVLEGVAHFHPRLLED